MQRNSSFWVILDKNFNVVSGKFDSKMGATQQAKHQALSTSEKHYVFECIYSVEVNQLVETTFDDIPF